MKLNLKGLQAEQTNCLKFSAEVDLSHLTAWGGHPFSGAARVQGSVRSRTEGLVLEYTALYTLGGECARCLSAVRSDREHTASHPVLIRSGTGEEDDQYLNAANGELELTPVVEADLLLSLESSLLCAADCKGLCPKCGANRNERDCGCILKEPDPRFAVLRELMEH